MRLEWSRLRILDAVARTGSVNQAAVLLHLTGPAVSQQLRRIEREAGTRVVVADGRGLRLTDAGRTLADYARQVTELMQRAENDLQHDEVTGTVKIGAIASSIRDLLTPRLGQLGNAHPDIAVSIEDGETDDHLQRLADGHLDIVIAESWTNAPLTLPAGVVSTELTRQTAYVAAPSDHWAVSVTEVHIADLAAEVWSTCARDSRDHEALVQAGRTRGIELEVRHFVADPLTQLSLVAGGLALACLPNSTAPADTDEVVFRRLAPTTERTILLLTDDRVPARAVETVRDALLAG